MRIGQFIQFGVGGADRSAENLIRGLLTIPSEELLIFYNEQSIPKLSSQWDLNAEMLNRQKNYNDLKLIKIDKISVLNTYSLDILNTHRSGDDLWALPGFEATSFNFKIIETNFHGALKTKADYRIFPSHIMVKKLGISRPHTVIPNAIRSPTTSEDLRGELGIQNRFVFGRVGRACNEIYSNINLLAYKQIESKDTVFVYVSPCNKAKEDAQSIGIKNIIFLDQTIDDVRISKIYNTFDVFCHSSSVGETFGNTIAEAMIHGKPVISHIGISSWSQAQPELLGEVTELFITNNILDNYSMIMKKLMEDKDYYKKVATYLKNRADELYDYRKVSKQYLNVYRKITGR